MKAGKVGGAKEYKRVRENTTRLAEQTTSW